MKTTLISLFSLIISTAAFAEETEAEAVPPPAPPAVEAVVTPAPPTSIVSDRSIGVHVAANIGLFELDGQYGHFYAFAAGNAGVPLLTDGRIAFGMMGAGYTVALSQPAESMWYMDILALGTVGKVDDGYSGAPSHAIGGAGLGLGFRYLHRSGFTFSAKVPLFGATLSSSGPYSGGQSLANFYLASAVALPMVSLGYRF